MFPTTKGERHEPLIRTGGSKNQVKENYYGDSHLNLDNSAQNTGGLSQVGIKMPPNLNRQISAKME